MKWSISWFYVTAVSLVLVSPLVAQPPQDKISVGHTGIDRRP
jgi:hypothetical protein